MSRTRLASRLPIVGLLGLTLLGTIACTPKTEVTVASPAQASGITVQGSATVTVKPDVARLNLGVEVVAPTVAAARNGAADAMTKVQGVLKQKGVQEKDIRTTALNISPRYSNSPSPNGSGTPTITGYAVSNQLQVTVRNIDSVSDVLDASVAAGGNAVRVQGVSFTVDQPEQFMGQARDEAVKNARARAETLAKAAGVTLGNPRSIAESSNEVGPVAPRASAAPAVGGAATPVNPGEQSLQLTVTVVYDIAGR